MTSGPHSVLFTVKEDGTISFEHTLPAASELLQQLLLRIDYGEGEDRRFEYVQFAPREVADANSLEAKPTKNADGTTSFHFRSPRILDSGNLAGRNARVRIGNAVYDLDGVRKNNELENRPPQAGPNIKLSIKGAVVIVTVKDPEIAKLAIEQLEIVRIIPPIPALNFPGYEQELLRFYPFKK